jgi:hypothetical protein
MSGLMLVVFAVTAGFTASAIAANLYRLSGVKTDTDYGQWLRLVVMTVAGPSVIFESAIRRFMAKEWSAIAFWLTASVVAYWSLAIGLFILDISIHA